MEEQFVRAILQQPDEVATYHAYADWLRDQDNEERAGFIQESHKYTSVLKLVRDTVRVTTFVTSTVHRLAQEYGLLGLFIGESHAEEIAAMTLRYWAGERWRESQLQDARDMERVRITEVLKQLPHVEMISETPKGHTWKLLCY